MDNKILAYGKGQLEMTPDLKVDSAKEETDYRESMRVIGEELQKTKQSFIKIGWHLKHIKDRGLYGRDGYSSIYEFAKDKFHISQSTATRFMNLCMEFSVGSDSPELDRKYEGFTVSQLVEMLPLGQEQKEKVTPDMTVRQIREIKNGGKKELSKKKEPGDIYATSHKDGTAGDRPEKKSGEPGLPKFNNDAECRSWLGDVEAWGLWYEDANIHARYYKHDFPDGSRLIAVKYRDACTSSMHVPQGQCGRQMEEDGSGYGEPYYHMIYSESHWENHADENMESHCRHYTHEATPIGELVDFLKELQERNGCVDSSEGRWVEFDTGHLEEKDNRGLPYLTRQYIKFYKRHGYIPRYLNIKNCTESKDYVPTLATGCGSYGGIGSVSIFNLRGNIEGVLAGGMEDPDIRAKEIAGLLSIASPEEREFAMEELKKSWDGLGLGTRMWKAVIDALDGIGGYEYGKIRFKVTKLTPEDCFQLMGLDRSVVERCRELGVSDTQLYKQAGNGIATNCVQLIMEHLYKAQEDPSHICTDEMINLYDTIQEE